MVYNQSGFRIEPGMIAFSHKCNDIPLEFAIPDKFSFDDTQVKQVAISSYRRQYFVSITYELEEPPYVDNGRYQAIDLGITHIVTAVNSQGKFLMVKNQRPDKYWNPKIAEIQSRKDKCKKFSNKWKLLNKIKHKYKRKRDNQTRDFQHKLSKKLVENTRANTLIVGQLEVKHGADIYESGVEPRHTQQRGVGTVRAFSNLQVETSR